jgi:hypothetical protein
LLQLLCRPDPTPTNAVNEPLRSVTSDSHGRLFSNSPPSPVFSVTSATTVSSMTGPLQSEHNVASALAVGHMHLASSLGVSAISSSSESHVSGQSPANNLQTSTATSDVCSSRRFLQHGSDSSPLHITISSDADSDLDPLPPQRYESDDDMSGSSTTS